MSLLTSSLAQNCELGKCVYAYAAHMELKERIRSLRTELNYSQSELARLCGVNPSAINHLESGRTQSLSGDLLVSLAYHLGVTEHWLSTGKGPMFRVGNTDRSAAISEIYSLLDHPDILPVQRVKFKLQAGVQGYAVEVDEGEGPPIFFRKDWFDSRGYKPERILAVRVTGASMEPSIYADDLVVINTEDTQPKDGEAFAVNYEGELGVKRLKRDAGEWWLASDNPDKRRYPDKRCNGDVQLLGRVVYRQTERI